MMDLSIVRRANIEDGPGIMKLCAMQAEEMAPFKISVNKVAFKIARAIAPLEGQNPTVCGVIGKPNALEGSIYLEVDMPWYSEEFALCELWNFVHPDHRKSHHAQTLIEFAKACGRGLGLPLSIGIFSNERTEAKVRLYQRRLGKPVGAFFYYYTNGAAH